MNHAFARMASFLTTVGLLWGVGSPVSAQRERRAAESLIPPPQLLAKLKVTPEQQGKLKAAVEALQAELQKLGAQASREERSQASARANEAYRGAIRSILTPEQLQQAQPILQEAARLGPLGTQILTLDLTDAQKTKLTAIADRYQPEFEKLRAEAANAGGREALRGKFGELEAQRAKELREVLTPEQQSQLSGREGRRGGISGPVPPEWLAQLNATGEQKSKIEAAVSAYGSALDQAQGLGREERGAAFGKAAEAYAATLREVLTAEQQQRIAAMFEEAGRLGGIGVSVYSLTLSDDQRSKLKEIAARHQPEMQKLRQAAAQTDNPREALRPQFEALQEKINSDVRAVLTPDQLKQLDEARGGRRRR